MTSPLTKDCLAALPVGLRDNIIIERETGYSLTMSMTIGDFESLVGKQADELMADLRLALEEAEREASHLALNVDQFESEALDATEAAEDAERERDKIAHAVQVYLDLLDISHPQDSPQAEALKALEDLL